MVVSLLASYLVYNVVRHDARASHNAQQLYMDLQRKQTTAIFELCEPDARKWLQDRTAAIGPVQSFVVIKASSTPFGTPTLVEIKVIRAGHQFRESVQDFGSGRFCCPEAL